MCPNFGTTKIINFTFRTNENFIIFGSPNIKALYSIDCLGDVNA